jgi:hypothetical protein
VHQLVKGLSKTPIPVCRLEQPSEAALDGVVLHAVAELS